MNEVESPASGPHFTAFVGQAAGDGRTIRYSLGFLWANDARSGRSESSGTTNSMSHLAVSDLCKSSIS